MSELKQPEVIRDASVESILAEKVLDETLTKPGAICPYSLLHERTGKNPQNGGYPYVATARRRFERKKGAVLDAVDNEGIKWLTPEEVAIARGERDAVHQRRHAKASLRRQKTTIGLEGELSKEALTLRNTRLAQFGALAALSGSKAQRAIASATSQSQRVLSARDALKHFAGEG